MKKHLNLKKICFAVLFSTLFFSCKKEGGKKVLPNPVLTVAADGVDIGAALDVARTFVVPAAINGPPPVSSLAQSKNPAATSNLGRAVKPLNRAMIDAVDFSKKIIDSYFVYKDADSVISMYVINYRAGGFIVVSASKKEHPVLAYSYDNNYPESIKNTNHPSSIWAYSVSTKMRALRKKLIKNSDSALIQTEWQKYAPVVDSAALARNHIGQINRVPDCPNGHWSFTTGSCITCPAGYTWNGTTCAPPPPCQVAYTVGPLVRTHWDQGCTYNNYTPADVDINNCNHTPAGCEAVAIAQILKFWQAGLVYIPAANRGVNGTTGLQTYNYSDAAMPLTYPGGNETDRLLSDIGVSVGMSYDPPSGSNPAESGANVNHQAFFKTAGFSSPVTETSYSTNDILGEISYGRPCLLGGYTYAIVLPQVFGNGHEWVCDGLTAVPNTCYPTYWAGYSVMVHLNWGWGGVCDGYYSPGSWVPYNNGVEESGDRFLWDQSEVINIWMGNGYPSGND